MKSKLTKFAQVAGIMLAMALTLSCSSNDDGNNNGGGSSGSGGGSGCPDATVGSGTLTCGGQTYKTVVIGSQTWMAKNLNYAIGESKCYGDSETNCTTYGRLYDWTTARLACPSGWHLPSHAEWSVLTDFVGKSTAGTTLKAESFGGTDNHKFAAIGGGCGACSNGSFYGIGESGFWWSATENSADDNSTTVTDDKRARLRIMQNNTETVSKDSKDKTYLLSVRCLKN